MKKLYLLLLVAFVTFSCSQKKQQNETVSKLDAKTLMAESMQRLTAAWNQGNAIEISKEFTKDAVRIISNPSSPFKGEEAILQVFESTFSEGSEFKDSHIEVKVIETRAVSADIYLGSGIFTILNKENEILEEGKWGNVFKYNNGQIKFLMESAHRNPKENKPSNLEVVLGKSISSEEPHFNKIEESVRSYITNYNSKNSEGLSMLFTNDAIQNVNSKEGIVLGREQIKLTENYSDGGELNAIILGYQYLGNNIAIAYGKWSSKAEDNSVVSGQWGNLFKIEGETALLIMESAGLL